MPLIDFSDEDILRSKIIDPGWYRVLITGQEQGLSKAGDSTNIVLKGKVLFNADTGGKEFENVPTPYWNFNTKAKGFMVGFFNSFGVDVKSGTRVDFADVVGKQLDVFIENDTYEGRLVNRINHKYRAPKAE